MWQSSSNKHPAPRSSFLTHFPIKETRDLILGLVQVIYKRRLEHLLVPESEEVLRKKKSNGYRSQPRKAPRSKLEEFEVQIGIF